MSLNGIKQYLKMFHSCGAIQRDKIAHPLHIGNHLA